MTARPSSPPVSDAVTAAEKLLRRLAGIDFRPHVSWVYNPLEYAWAAHRQYLERFLPADCRVLFLGMNPGPWGMAQTGVPFGEVSAVRDWLGIEAPIGRPRPEHPKRPVEGLQCPRSEVSGRRLWGLFQQRFGTPEEFLAEHFVANYCPLVFMEESGRNVTPDKLPAVVRSELEAACDEHLLSLLRLLRPRWSIGVGGFAEKCLRRVQAANHLDTFQVGRILHPSPASPAANRDWSGQATNQLSELGIW